MVRIDATYQGDLHTVCRHGPSGAELETDAPVDNQGRGASFSPTDLLATSLGSCMLTVMSILARRKGWAMEGARVSVDKHMATEPVRRIGRLVVDRDDHAVQVGTSGIGEVVGAVEGDVEIVLRVRRHDQLRCRPAAEIFCA